jgi:hypothetical protein
MLQESLTPPSVLMWVNLSTIVKIEVSFPKTLYLQASSGILNAVIPNIVSFALAHNIPA